ncbi:MAG TPA: outer membrane beta-barrel protein [Methylosinus sp.]|jgi:outer membrane immunogenic protein
MKLIGAAVLAIIAFAAPAVAADLGAVRPVVAPVPPPPPPPSWSGLYVGLNAGWAWGATRDAETLGYSVYDWASGALGMPFGFSAPYVTGVAGLEQNGFVGGAQLGYNQVLGSRFLVGVETDFDGTTLRGSGVSPGFASQVDEHGLLHLQAGRADVRAGLSWIGSLRGRIGYLFNPALLLYGTGGLAYGGRFADLTTFGLHWHPQDRIGHPDNPVLPAWNSANAAQAGWIAGGGFEWSLAPQWSVKSEALYYDLGDMRLSTFPSALINPAAPSSIAVMNVATTRLRYDGVITRLGLNYHFAAPMAAIVAGY